MGLQRSFGVIVKPHCAGWQRFLHSLWANRPPSRLYRNSIGHGGLYCAACHNSPHAELPTAQARDAVQVLRVQGTSTYIRSCTVCHLSTPTGPGPHGYNPVSKVDNWKIYGL